MGGELSAGQNWGDGAYFSDETIDLGVQTGDFNGDGFTDLMYRGKCGNPGVACWRVQFSNGVDFSTGIDWGDNSYFSEESTEFGLQCGDFNGDGLSDMVYRGKCGSTGVACWRMHLSTGTTFATPLNWGDGAYFSDTTSELGLQVADFNADGRDDIAYRGKCGNPGLNCWRVHLSLDNSLQTAQHWSY